MTNHTHEIIDTQQTTCCIVGGGPAGVVLGLLLGNIKSLKLRQRKIFPSAFCLLPSAFCYIIRVVFLYP